jgi:hypothetical protein
VERANSTSDAMAPPLRPSRQVFVVIAPAGLALRAHQDHHGRRPALLQLARRIPRHTMTGLNIFPYPLCSCTFGRPRSSTTCLSLQFTMAITLGCRSELRLVRTYPYLAGLSRHRSRRNAPNRANF